MPTAIVAEDEPILRQQLEAKLAKLWPELEIIASVEDGVAALEALEDRAPDFMFLDIQMPEMTGVEVARHVGSRAHVVFVTAYDQYAIQAFETGAADYVLKPATDERLAVTIERLKAKLAAPTPPPDLNAVLSQLTRQISAGKPRMQWVKASIGQTLRMIPVSEVLYLRAELKYVTVKTAEREYLVEESLQHLEEEFDPAFVRVHRNCLVAREAIAGFERNSEESESGWAVVIRATGEKLPVSRRQHHVVKQFK
jgi:DNA-binding LytR/AlgR family response regulator